MTDLLELVLAAHGGLKNWRWVTAIDIQVTLGGNLFEIKGFPDGLRTAVMRLDARQPRTLIVPFPERGKRAVFERAHVHIEADNGEVLSALDNPHSSYEEHVRATPWSDLQFAYFVSYAFWNYMTTPFLLAPDDVAVREVESWSEHGQTWRVLEATFGERIDTHCAEQRFYFDEGGMLVRHDYYTEVAKGVAAHYCFDPRPFGGFLFPTRRRVVARDAERHSALTGPSSVWIELDSVIIR